MPVVHRFKPPLTIEQLQDIQSRRRDDADVIALLWEIRRLQSTVMRADQLMRTIDESGGIAHRMVVDALRDDLAEEPCLEEIRRLRSEVKSDPDAGGKKPYRHPSDR